MTSRRVRPLARAFAALATLASVAAAAASCGSSFDPAYELQSLRVLAVKKSAPYAKPGEKVDLGMLWVDERPGVKAPAEVVWFAGCVNPEGDLYYGCYPQLAAAASSSVDGGTGGLVVGAGNTFSWTVPKDIISSRPAPESGDPYGLAYVFFAVCAGHVAPAAPGSGLPLRCLDAAGNEIGAEGFVPGFTAIYAYDERRNENPKLDDLAVDGKSTADAAIVAVPRCEGDGCATVELAPVIDRASAEVDPAATGPDGQTLREQLWIDYYVPSGTLDHPLRLVNDAQAGWNDENRTAWTPPAEPGELSIYAVLHDNRGGMAWRERRIRVE